MSTHKSKTPKKRVDSNVHSGNTPSTTTILLDKALESYESSDSNTGNSSKISERRRRSARTVTSISKLRIKDYFVASDDDDDEENDWEKNQKIKVASDSTRRRSSRKIGPSKQLTAYFFERNKSPKARKSTRNLEVSENSDEDDIIEISDSLTKSKINNLRDEQLKETDYDFAGANIYGFNTPKKRDAMAVAATNATPRTPKTPRTVLQCKTPDTKTKKTEVYPKTPAHVRKSVKNQIAKLMENSDSDFSADESDYQPSDKSDSSSNASSSDTDMGSGIDDEPKTPTKTRRAIVVPVLPKTPSTTVATARLRRNARLKKSTDFVPQSDSYFQTHASSKILTSDHTLDRLKNPRLPAGRLFSLLSEMKLTTEHETAMNAMLDEYRTYFTKWLCILNEGYNILIYGLGSKRQLLQSFHRAVLKKQNVLVVNGFFPSLTLKDVLDSITNEFLGAGIINTSNAHEAVDMIEEEFALTPEMHLYLIVHNLDGVMVRNARAQAIISRLAKIPNIHLLATIDHINTPLLWDQNKLSNFNFSWWDCTTMLPYTDETAFENSLLVQNSGELALSSMRSVFSSLTANSRGIYMLIVKHQLNQKGNSNYQGMSFKDLYWSCREAFLVSSDLALRAQLTEFLDHKLVKSKRNVDGTEQLLIPIESSLLQQFLDEQEKN